MEIYLLGPTSGLPNENRNKFSDVAQQLRARGLKVVNFFEDLETYDMVHLRRDDIRQIRITCLLNAKAFVIIEPLDGDLDAMKELEIANEKCIKELQLRDLLSKVVLYPSN